MARPEHTGPDSEDAASEQFCLHGPTLAIGAPRVLIENNHSAIDGSDERQKRHGNCPATAFLLNGRVILPG